MQNFFDFYYLADNYHLGWVDWLWVLLAGVVVGFSKSGIKGISILVVTLLALVFGSKASTGILLPLLTVGDVLAVWYYRRHAQWKYLYRLMPWMMGGVLLGVWLGNDLPEAVFKDWMAVIILLSIILMFWWERKKDKKVPDQWWFAGMMGSAAGFTTMLGNLAGPIANIFFLAMRLPKNEFIGTAAWLFFIINLFKLPFHIFVWETVSLSTLSLNLRLVPSIVLGFIAGVYLVNLIRDTTYRYFVMVMIVVGAMVILLR